MKLKATTPTAQLDYSTGDVVLSFRIPKESRATVDEVLSIKGDLSLDVKKYRKQRSMDANAYMWVLCDKIAAELRTTKEMVYRNIIRRVGVFDSIAVREKAVDPLMMAWESRGIGWVAEVMRDSTVKGCKVVTLYYGSSCYDSEQFSRLLDEIISDAKEIGIDTATPDEIALMKARWNDERQKNQSA